MTDQCECGHSVYTHADTGCFGFVVVPGAAPHTRAPRCRCDRKHSSFQEVPYTYSRIESTRHCPGCDRELKPGTAVRNIPGSKSHWCIRCNPVVVAVCDHCHKRKESTARHQAHGGHFHMCTDGVRKGMRVTHVTRSLPQELFMGIDLACPGPGISAYVIVERHGDDWRVIEQGSESYGSTAIRHL